MKARLRSFGIFNRVAAAVTVFVALLVLYPLVMLFVGSFLRTPQGKAGEGGMLEAVALAFTDNTNALLNSVLVGVVSSAIALALGTVFAWLLARCALAGKRVLRALIVVPFYLTPIMGAAGWSILASPGRTGFLNQFVGSFIGSYPFNIHGPRGIIWVLGLYFAPAAYLLIASSLESMDPSLEESGQVHGAGVFRTARLISLPLVMPAITSSFILIFVLSIGQFGVPAVLGVPYGFPVITTRIYEYVVGLQPNYVAAAALGVALLIIAVAFTWMQNRLLSRRSYVTVSGKGLKHREIGLGLWHIPALILMWAYVTLAVVLPFAALIWASLLRFMTSNLATARYTFGNFTYVLGEYALTQRAIVNTFLVTIPAATVVVLLGAILGWTRLRSRLSGAWIAEYIASLPLAIPSIVFSIGLLWAWIFFPVLPIYGTLWLLVICYVTIFIPLGYRAATSGLMQIDRSLEECALVHGVPQGKTFCSITLPLLRPALWAGWCLVFISTLKELSASALLTNSKTIVMSVAVFELWTGGSFPRVAAFSLIEAALIFVVLLLAGGFGRSLQKA